ncbi:MAG: hypothetical protein CVV47_07735 [Spirochaetae bacterium HGW-Spirochaetae-3]|jgi:hypothetical protein|nr:MAG: hypothetical protein CVV47_07735 [Spirochaetae bacterium HGW-Spirochaetae-3]
MSIDFDALTTTALSEAFPERRRIPGLAASLAGDADLRALARRLAGATSCITMLAGSGSRWVSSLAEAAAAGEDTGADPTAPRGLFPVQNAMPFGPDPIPIAAYALAAVRDLGRHIVVVRGWEREIEERILAPLAYPVGSWRFATQDAPGGKPRGHGDAAFQTMGEWSGSEYVIVNFGGDASSPLTALSSLAVMDALARSLGDEAPGLLMPAAFVPAPAYPIALDGRGLPTRFGHAKLQGVAPSTGAPSGGYTNVGVRVYRASALRGAIERVRRDHWTAERGYAIPGNAPAPDDTFGGEFALDNVDAMLASEGRARLLCTARPAELSPVKSLADLGRFERDSRIVCGDWAALEG